MEAETESVEEIREDPSDVPEQLESIVEEVPEAEERGERTVPLSALKDERRKRQEEKRKRQEAEQRAKLFEDLQTKQLREQQLEEPQDEDQYEAVTKADLGKQEKLIVRAVEERSWIKQNPEKFDEVNDKLADFLKQRPNLASAIEISTNRYEEAWTLMHALSPRQRSALKPAAPKKDSPGSPGSVPKAAAINESVDVMTMSDSEFYEWRKKKRRSG